MKPFICLFLYKTEYTRSSSMGAIELERVYLRQLVKVKRFEVQERAEINYRIN